MNSYKRWFAILVLLVASRVLAIGPDQEAYNNIAFFVEVLSEDPGSVPFVKEELQKYDTTRLSSNTVALLYAMQERCSDMAKVQRQIEYLNTDGEKAIADRGFSDGLEGGAAAAGMAATIDYQSDGEINGNPLVYAVVGIAGGLIKHVVESGKVREQVSRAITEEQEKQKDILAGFQQDINRFKQLGEFSSFDESLLYRAGVMQSMPQDTAENYLNTVKREGIFKYRVAVLNTLISDYALANVPDPQWVEFSADLVKEWPTCLDKNHPIYSRAMGNLAYAALLAGNIKKAEELATEAISRLASNDNAFNNRAIARMRDGRGDEALTDINKAISINPKNSWYQYSKARIYALALKDKNNALDSLKQAFSIGFCDIPRLRSDPELSLISAEPRFLDLTTVKWEWRVSNGIFFSDVYLKNTSPFPITRVKLASATSGWNPELTTDVIQSGETFHWGWVSQPPEGKQLQANLTCDQVVQ